MRGIGFFILLAGCGGGAKTKAMANGVSLSALSATEDPTLGAGLSFAAGELFASVSLTLANHGTSALAIGPNQFFIATPDTLEYGGVEALAGPCTAASVLVVGDSADCTILFALPGGSANPSQLSYALEAGGEVKVALPAVTCMHCNTTTTGTTGTTNGTTGGMPMKTDADCAHELDFASCSTCCGSIHPAGNTFYNEEVANCECESGQGNCRDLCSISICLDPASTDDKLCSDCVADDAICDETINCMNDSDCATWLACVDACP